MPGASDRKKVLIVDDTPENIRVLMAILGNEYQIVTAPDGQQALLLAHSDPVPDLILLDVRMPGMDGYELCRRLKASDKTSKVPVIFITTMAEEEDERKGRSLGAVDYITKPYSPSHVKASIRSHLEREPT